MQSEANQLACDKNQIFYNRDINFQHFPAVKNTIKKDSFLHKFSTQIFSTNHHFNLIVHLKRYTLHEINTMQRSVRTKNNESKRTLIHIWKDFRPKMICVRTFFHLLYSFKQRFSINFPQPQKKNITTYQNSYQRNSLFTNPYKRESLVP